MRRSSWVRGTSNLPIFRFKAMILTWAARLGRIKMVRSSLGKEPRLLILLPPVAIDLAAVVAEGLETHDLQLHREVQEAEGRGGNIVHGDGHVLGRDVVSGHF